MDQTTSGGATAPTPPPPPPPPAGGSYPGAAQPGQPGQPSPPSPPHRFFESLRGGIVRSEHRVIGGVCNGIAERTGIDVTVIRVAAVILAVFSGVGFLAYGLAWLFLPEPDGRIHAERILHGDVHAGAVGAIIVTVSSLGSTGGLWGGWFGTLGWGGHGPFGLLWHLISVAVLVALIAFVVYLVSATRTPNRTPAGASYPTGTTPTPSWDPNWPATAPATSAPATSASPTTVTAPVDAPLAPNPPAPPMPMPMAPTTPMATTPMPTTSSTTTTAPPRPGTPRRKTFGASGALVVGGLALVAGAATALIMRNGSYDARTSVMAWAVALCVLAAGLIIGGLLGRRSGIVSLFALIAIAGTLTTAVIPTADERQLTGERVWTPVTTSTATGGFALGAGDATIDLSRLDTSSIATTPLTVPVSVGAGRLTIRVPAGVDVHIKASAVAGNLQALPTSVTTPGGTSNDGSDLGGFSVERSYDIGTTGTDDLNVVAKVGFGTIRIQQEQP